MSKKEPELDGSGSSQSAKDKFPPSESSKPKTPPSEPVEKEGKPPESKTRRFFRLFFRWTLGVLIVFGLGVITAFMLFYNPKAKELEQSMAETKALEAKITELKGEIERLSSLEKENKVLQTQAEQSDLHALLLSTLTDAYTAQLALSREDFDDAKVQLATTPDKITELSDRLGEEAVAPLIQRLDFIKNDLESADLFASQSDLEVLTNNLVQLENNFFANP